MASLMKCVVCARKHIPRPIVFQHFTSEPETSAVSMQLYQYPMLGTRQIEKY